MFLKSRYTIGSLQEEGKLRQEEKRSKNHDDNGDDEDDSDGTDEEKEEESASWRAKPGTRASDVAGQALLAFMAHDDTKKENHKKR